MPPFSSLVPPAGSLEATLAGSRPYPTNKGHVLHVINGEHYSGAERVQDLLARRLPDWGYEPGFACLKQGRFAQQRESQATPLFALPMRFRFDLRAVHALTNVVRQGAYRLVHAHTVRGAMIASAAARRLGVPFVYHVHSPAAKDSTRWLANRVNALVERVSICRAEAVICVSQSLAAHMAGLGRAADRIQVVANGVPVRSESLTPRSAPDSRWVLGSVALFRPRKGTEVLIEALSILRGAGHNVRLRAVGPFESAAYEAKLRKLAADLEVDQAIEWTGFTKDVNAQLDDMDALVLPSLFGEGLPMVVLEAMAAGVPVIGTTVQGVPEVLQGGNGILVPPGCADALAEAIRRLICGQEDWTMLRNNAWRRQADCFSDRSMAAGVAEVYDRVLGVRK